MKPAILKKATTLLSKTFHVVDFLDNALAVSFASDDLPFALIIVEEDSPDTLYLAVAVDSPDPHSCADIALRLVHMAKTEISEPFYLGKDGEIHWGADAYSEYMGSQPDSTGNQAFLDLESPSKLVN